MILDTNFIIDLLSEEETALEKLDELREKREPLLLAPGTIFELKVGSGKDRAVDRIEKSLNRAELTSAIETEAANIRRKLEEEGEPISTIDYLIAGTARQMNETLLTRDQHFERVENLQTESF